MNEYLTFSRDLSRRVRLMVARSIVRLVSDSDGIQTLQLSILRGETQNEVERFQNYGMTSVPLSGAEAAVVFVGGNRDHGLVIAVDDRRYRVKGLADGEVCVYTDEDSGENGHRIHLKRGGIVEVKCTTAVVTAGENATVSAGGNITLEAEGNIVATASGVATITAPSVSINATSGGAECNITGNAVVNVSGSLELGGSGGQGVARIGDVVTVGSGSSAGDWPITSGSSKVKAI